MRKLIFLVFLLSTSNVFGLTLSEIRDGVRLRAKDVGVSGQRRTFTDAQLNGFINQTQRDVVNVTWSVKKSTDIILVENTTFYTMPTDFITVDRLIFDNRNLYELRNVFP